MTTRTRVVRWRPITKNTLRRFADVELPIGLTIREIPVHASHGKLWAALPAKPQFGQDGQPRRVEGKVAYSPILEWRSRRLREAFSDRVVEVVRQQHPNALH
jgi:hypothetical protein